MVHGRDDGNSTGHSYAISATHFDGKLFLLTFDSYYGFRNDSAISAKYTGLTDDGLRRRIFVP